MNEQGVVVDMAALGSLFTQESQSINPAKFPDELFLHYSLPAFDEFGGPVLTHGVDIESNKTLLREDSILVSKLNPRKPRVQLARRSRVPLRQVSSTEFISLVPVDDRSDLEYFKHLVNSSAVQSKLDSVATGTTNSHVRARPRDLLNQCVFVPPLSEQRRIAQILDTLDDQIRATEQIIAKLSVVKQGLVADLFSGDWPVGRLGESATLITSGSRGWSRFYSDEGAKFIRIGNLTRSHINLRFDSMAYVSVPSHGEGSRTALRGGDLLVSITADLGIIGVAPSGLGEAYINQHVALVRFNGSQANPRWVGHYLSSPLGQAQFSRLNDQGAKAGLNLPTISNLEFPIPPLDLQRQVVATLDATDASIAHSQLEVQKLQKHKKGLMADLLTGRVRAPLETAS